MKYTIEEMSQLLGVTPHMLRYYEKVGIIRPETNKAMDTVDWLADGRAVERHCDPAGGRHVAPRTQPRYAQGHRVCGRAGQLHPQPGRQDLL